MDERRDLRLERRPLGFHIRQHLLEAGLDGGNLLHAGCPLVADRQQLGLLVLDLLDHLRLLSLLGFEVGLHDLDRGPLLLQLPQLAAVFTNDVIEEEDPVHQVGEVRRGEDQLQPTDLAALVHDPHPMAEIGDVLRQLGLLEGELLFGQVHLLTELDQLRRLLVDLDLDGLQLRIETGDLALELPLLAEELPDLGLGGDDLSIEPL